MTRAPQNSVLRRFAALSRRGPFRRGQTTGTAAIEFGIFIPVLVLMIIGLYEYSRWIGIEIELEQALRAGAQVAMAGPNSTTAAAVQGAVQAATDLSPAPTVYFEFTTNSTPRTSTPYTACICPDGTANLCPGASNYSNCTGDVSPGYFVTIAAETTYDPLFADLPGLSANMPVWQELTFRVR